MKSRIYNLLLFIQQSEFISNVNNNQSVSCQKKLPVISRKNHARRNFQNSLIKQFVLPFFSRKNLDLGQRPTIISQ